jgi:hypothetical protein
MPNKNKEKGNVLEKAVALIQEVILRTDPKLAGTGFSIELNKIEIVSGVRHEIDVFVKTLRDSPYESNWIFECKNRNEPANKNDVIILAEKVKAFGANRGFLVARNFTKDAEAQVKLDGRLEFISCTDEFLNPSSNAELIQRDLGTPSLELFLKPRKVSSTEHPTHLEWKGKICRLKNEIINFESFLNKQAGQLILEVKNEDVHRYCFEGTHTGERVKLIEFNRGEFMIGDLDLEHIKLTVKFSVTVRKRRLISKFELKDQARVFSFEPIDIVSGKKIEVNIVEKI